MVFSRKYIWTHHYYVVVAAFPDFRYSLYKSSDPYKAAKNAQKSWAKALPQIRSDIMTKAANIIEQRKDEIAQIMTQECGSTVIKRTIEMQIGINIIRESASFPTRQHGYIFDSFTPGIRNHCKLY